MVLGLLVCRGNSFGENATDWDLKASVKTGYDSNITYVNDDEREDFMTNILLGLGLRHQGKTSSLRLEGQVVQQLFARYHSFNNSALSLNADFRKELSANHRLALTDQFSHSEEPRSFEEEFGRAPGRYSLSRNVFHTDFAHDVSKQWTHIINFDNEVNIFSRDDLHDSVLNRLGWEGDFSLDSANVLKGIYQISYQDYESDFSVLTNSLAGGYRHYFSADLYLDLLSGVDFIDVNRGSDYTRPRYSAALTKELNETTKMGFAYERRYTTTAFEQDIFDAWKVSVNYIKELTQRLRGALRVFYGKGEYQARDRRDELLGTSWNLSYDLNPHTIIELNYQYSTVDSNQNNSDYIKNTIFLGISVLF